MKYMGSKARFSKEILNIILKGREHNQWYVEPFAGGMNTICEVKNNRIANDVHTPLIEMWRKLVCRWEPKKITKNIYMKVKDNQAKYPDYLVGWVGFNCSYSGKWFGGFAGETKTKIGTIRDYQDEALRNIKRQITKMQGIMFQNKSYNDLKLPPNSIVYCDPPYEGVTKYADKFDHNLFWNWARDVSKQGHTVFVSEYKAPDDFVCVWEKRAKSSLSANGKSGGSKNSVEKLFRYKREILFRRFV